MKRRDVRRGAAPLVAAMGMVLMVLAGCRPLPPPPPGPAPAPDPVRDGNVGMNVGWVADWSTELPFVDVMKTARPWVSNRTGSPWGQGGPLELDQNGWVARLDSNQYATTVMLGIAGRYPAGRYTLLYDGEGTMRIDSSAVQIVSQEPGRWVLDVTPQATGGIMLHVLTTDPANNLRNIRLIMPGHEGTYDTHPFNPVFLERMRPFDTIRFTWWMRRGAQSNGPGTNVHWGDRPLPHHAFQSDRGVALEYMIDVANELNTDAWLHIPHDADDEYVTEFARLVRDRLEPGLRVYIEYSNETWLSGTPQADWVIARGLERGLSTDRFQAGLRYHAVRAGEIFTIWDAVFGGDDRFVRVLSAQAGNPWTGRQVLDQAAQGTRGDVVAIAPYFHCVRQIQLQPDGLAQVLAMTDDELMDACENEVRTYLPGLLQEWSALAQQHGVELVAYEGGQHLVGVTPAQQANTELSQKIARVNRMPRMGSLYTEYLDLWRASGGGQFVAFSSVGAYGGPQGAFGALEHQDQDPATAPKYEALVEAARG